MRRARLFLANAASDFCAVFLRVYARAQCLRPTPDILPKRASEQKGAHSLQVLDDEGRGAAAAVADAGAADAGLLLAQDRGEGGDDAGAGAAERVADGNGAAEDVDAVRVEPQELDVGE